MTPDNKPNPDAITPDEQIPGSPSRTAAPHSDAQDTAPEEQQAHEAAWYGEDDVPDEVRNRVAAEFYCPGCGRPFAYPGECTGASAEAPHQPIQVVSTQELRDNDPRDPDVNPREFTAAPATEF